MEIKDEWFKHFRTFLKQNDLYKEFMECFRKQAYVPLHTEECQFIRNFPQSIKKRWGLGWHNEFGAMVMIFDSFTWVFGGKAIPREFTDKWCTVGLKWGLYCIEHNLEICTIRRFIELLHYWEGNGWIIQDMLSDSENKLIEDLIIKYQNGDIY